MPDQNPTDDPYAAFDMLANKKGVVGEYTYRYAYGVQTENKQKDV